MLHTITKEEKKEIYYQRFHHPHPRVQLKMEVLWLYGCGKSNSEIAWLTNLSENTTRKYLQDYQKGGLEELKKINFYQPNSELDNYQDTLEKYFRENPPMSFKEAGAKIAELTRDKKKRNSSRTILEKVRF